MENVRIPKFIDWIWSHRLHVENFLAVLSMLAVALVVGSEFIRGNPQVPVIGVAWVDLQIWVRTSIWLAFLVSFVVFAISSRRPIKFIRSHILELIICVTWVPHHSDGSMLSSLNELISLSRLVPIEVLNLVGTLAHAWRVVRWTADRFQVHPVFVTGSAAVVLIGAAGALLHHFEPQTFPTYWHGVWYALATVTTIGYGDIVPHTPIGYLIGVATILCGVSLFGVFIAVVQHNMRRRLLKNDPETLAANQLHEDLKRNNELLERILSEMATNNRLVKELVERQSKPADTPEEKLPERREDGKDESTS